MKSSKAAAATTYLKDGLTSGRQMLDQGGEILSDLSDRAGETANKLSKSLISYTKKKPITALLLAVGAGALLASAATTVRLQR